jgi:hypothetical protein
MEADFIALVAKYPQAIMVFTAVGVLRAIFKPIMVVLENYVKATPSADDDVWLEKLKVSKPYKVVAWLLDYTASIKLPVK